MADLSDAELAELDGTKAKAMRYAPDIALLAYTWDGRWARPEITEYINLLLRQSDRIIAEVRRLRAENAELRKRSDPTDFDELHRKLGIKPFDEHDVHDLTDDM